MQTTANAINNSATPMALRGYIPDHLLDTSKRDYYENSRIAVELQVRSIGLSVETSPANRADPFTLRVCTGEFGVHLDPQGARALALALLQLADVQEELAQQQGSATQRASDFTGQEQYAAGVAVECFGAHSPEALRLTRHIVERSGKTWLTESAPTTTGEVLA